MSIGSFIGKNIKRADKLVSAAEYATKVGTAPLQGLRDVTAGLAEAGVRTSAFAIKSAAVGLGWPMAKWGGKALATVAIKAPTLSGTLLGGTIGAVTGGITGALSGDTTDPNQVLANAWGGMTAGATMGASLGFSVGGLGRIGKNYNKKYGGTFAQYMKNNNIGDILNVGTGRLQDKAGGALKWAGKQFDKGMDSLDKKYGKFGDYLVRAAGDMNASMSPAGLLKRGILSAKQRTGDIKNMIDETAKPGKRALSQEETQQYRRELSNLRKAEKSQTKQLDELIKNNPEMADDAFRTNRLLHPGLAEYRTRYREAATLPMKSDGKPGVASYLKGFISNHPVVSSIGGVGMVSAVTSGGNSPSDERVTAMGIPQRSPTGAEFGFVAPAPSTGVASSYAMTSHAQSTMGLTQALHANRHG